MNDRPIGARKSDLRAAILAARKIFASSNGTAAGMALAGPVLELPIFAQEGAVVGGYWPIRGEADPRPLLMALGMRRIPTALPVVVEDDLSFHLWRDGEVLVPAGLGTFGPDTTAPVVRPSILLVPLVAFDRRGYRLGYGRGFYDRVVARLKAAGPLATIGLAYAMQEVPAVPTEPHDQPLDYVATEHGVLVTGAPPPGRDGR
ncbi:MULTISPECIES: 5-formyltetrahydrofolate cyclo-ligase [unclassified Chelatococcus]|uniref:5-formyltetrahydrofolate cyclo-ligase n=1 Tax=unclassified Chelatococcus TaxID=2638111 RepID=UPI001BCB43F3|nr:MULTISPECIES: 5-formyltetrahydrofolate cyclo-ligase [unclassified Chelatococcus]MBS7741091.1 5-formyltetrahydrofolate cyclo-ligase [Chelatococcus sp. HY11]MBX3545277.1 5-formyltetrahydrofolate cyclo-ligase [Chelatococcus sp.]MCO5077910.1 5-formyltetrahydrofolate cyclo-ligase [Chelatococcus sp.]